MYNLIPKFILNNYLKKEFSGSKYVYCIFFDISGFTKITEELMKKGKEGAEILNYSLKRVMEPTIEEIYLHGGYISGFAGDAFTVLIPETKPPETIKNLVEKVLDIFEQKGKITTKFGSLLIQLKAGLSFGLIEWYIVNTSSFSTYYYKGQALWDCSYIQKECKPMNYLIHESYYEQCKVYSESVNQRKIIKDTETNYRNNILSKAAKMQLEHFLPNGIFEIDKDGEFRDVLSVFISGRKSDNTIEYNNFLEFLMNKAYLYEGYIESIDFGDKGNMILVLFGVPLSKGQILERALQFSLDIRSKFQDKIKIGIAMGLVFAGFKGSRTRSSYGVIGTTVNLSCRFMESATWGEIWLTDWIKQSIKENYDLSPRGSINFKGIENPVKVFNLEKAKDKLFINDRIDVIGRDNELTSLKEFIEQHVKQQCAGFFLISGDAGIGKSRLLRQLKKETENTNKKLLENKEKKIIIHLYCNELINKSFNPFIRYFVDFFDINDSDETNIKQRKINSSYNRLIRQLDIEKSSKVLALKPYICNLLNIDVFDKQQKNMSAKKIYDNTLFAIRLFIETLSFYNPILIILEDIHWVDADTKNLIKYLKENLNTLPICFIVSSRNKYSQYYELFEKCIELEDIDENSSFKLIESHLIDQINLSSNKFCKYVPMKTISWIYDKSQGNPFFIDQITKYLSLTNMLDENLELKSNELQIPTSINSIVLGRLDLLSINQKNIIKTAAVLGQRFTKDILDLVIDCDSERYLISGEKQFFWYKTSSNEYEFSHNIIKEVAYEMQTKKQLRSKHKKTAEVYESISKKDPTQYYDELIYHFRKAEIDTKVIYYLDLAGMYNKKIFRNNIAVNYLLELEKYYNSELLKIDELDFLEYKHIHELSLSLDQIELIRKKIEKYIVLVLEIGEIQTIFCEWEKVIKSFENIYQYAIFNKDFKRAARIKRLIGFVYYRWSKFEKAEKYCMEALKLTEEGSFEREKSNVNYILANIYVDQGDCLKAEKYIKRHLDFQIKHNDVKGLADGNLSLGIIKLNLGYLNEAADYFKQSVPQFIEVNDKENLSRVYGNLGVTYRRLGKVDLAKGYYQKCLKISIELGDKKGQFGMLINLGILEKADYPDVAKKNFLEALEIAKIVDDKGSFMIATANLGQYFMETGDFIEAKKKFFDTLTFSQEIGHSRGIAFSYENLGRIYKNLEKYSEAINFFHKNLEIVKELNEKQNIAVCYSEIAKIKTLLADYIESENLLLKCLDITKELNLDYYYCLYQQQLAELYYLMKNYKKSFELNVLALDTAKQQNRKETLFDAMILQIKIDYEKSQDKNNKYNLLELMMNLNCDNLDLSMKAQLFFEIWQLSKKLHIDHEKYYTKSLEFNKQAYDKSKDITYKLRLRDMKVIVE